MTRHFLAEGSVHLALEGHDLQGKADSVCARQGPQPAGVARGTEAAARLSGGAAAAAADGWLLCPY